MVQLGGEPFVQEYSEVPQGTKIVRHRWQEWWNRFEWYL